MGIYNFSVNNIELIDERYYIEIIVNTIVFIIIYIIYNFKTIKFSEIIYIIFAFAFTLFISKIDIIWFYFIYK